MAENFSNQLAQWVEQRGLQRSDQNRVAFLAVCDDVKLAIDAGYAVKTVWANLRDTGRIDFGYKTFHMGARRGHLVKTGPVVPHKRLADLLIDRFGIGMEYHADMHAGRIRRRGQIKVIDAGPDHASLVHLVDLPFAGTLGLQEFLPIHYQEAMLVHKHRQSGLGRVGSRPGHDS